MTLEEIKSQCKILHLPTVYSVIAEQEAITESNNLSFIDRIGLIFERELVDRQNKKIERLIKGAFFKYQPEINSIIYNAERNLSKDMILNLISGGYIVKKEYYCCRSNRNWQNIFRMCDWNASMPRHAFSKIYSHSSFVYRFSNGQRYN